MFSISSRLDFSFRFRKPFILLSLRARALVCGTLRESDTPHEPRLGSVASSTYKTRKKRMVIDGDRRASRIELLLRVLAVAAPTAVGAYFGFGVPIFMLAIMGVLFTSNWATRTKWQKEVSPWSIYNADGKQLPGTLDAAKIDRELRGGPGIADTQAGGASGTAGQRRSFGGKGSTLRDSSSSSSSPSSSPSSSGSWWSLSSSSEAGGAAAGGAEDRRARQRAAAMRRMQEQKGHEA